MSTIELSERVKRVKPSPTLAVTTRARELKASGKDVIGLGAGEPDFDTPEHIKQAAIKAIQEGFTKYTAVDGTPELKKAIITKFEKDNGLTYQADQILVSCGGKQSFFNLAQALLNAGDEAIIPAPYWVSYPDMVLLADGTPIIVSAGIDQQFKLKPEQLESAITAKTKLFVINSPSNPTGVSYSLSELEALGKVLRKHPNIVIATDDMYEHVVWGNEPFCNILNACPDLTERTVVLNGVSKAYSMTGWRIGYAGGPKALISAMKKIQSQSTSNPTSISQVAATAALQGPQDCIQSMVKAFKQRHDYVVTTLNTIKGVHCLPSDGTFYAFPDMNNAISNAGSFENDVAFAEFVLEKTGVAMVPGSAFGAEGHMRLSFATDMESLKEALSRLRNLLGSD